MKKITISIIVLLLSFSSQAQKFEELALTPPMGWNSWNKFGCDVSEKLIKEIADAMVSTGLKDAGYEYVVIDDCWQIDRDQEGNIVVDPERFPSGMKALADYVHSKGLKFGIYSDAGTKTCQGRPGSRGYEFRDARTYASWGVDYLKYDWCHTGTQNAPASYKLMRDALYEAGRPIVFSICEWGQNDPWEWAPEIGHLWRTTGDIRDCWECEMNWGGMGWTKILDKQNGLEEYAGPGHWNDPDMLEVGNEGLTTTQSKAHFSMWCMLAAPLMAGNDIRDMSKETLEILTNKEAIAINQDKAGKQGFKVMSFDEIEVWVKKLQDEDMAVCFLNRDDDEFELSWDWDKYYFVDKTEGWKGIDFSGYSIRDIWNKKDIGNTSEMLEHELLGYDVLMLKLSK